MKAFLSLACVFTLSGQLSMGQAIEGAESLRDRSRILQKKNPVSSETSGFSSFDGLTSNGDAEGVSQFGYLWATSISSSPSGSINLLSRYNAMTENFGYGARARYEHPFDENGRYGISIDIGTNRFDRRFDSLQYLWDEEPDSSVGLTLPNTARFDVRTLETESKHARLFGQATFGKTRVYAVGSHSVIDDMDERLRLEYKTSGDTSSDDSLVTFQKNRKRNSLRRSPDQRTENVYGVGAELALENTQFRAGAVTRSWKRLRPGTYTVQFEDGIRDQLTLDLSDPTRPVAVEPLVQENLSTFEFLEIRFEDKTTHDSDDIVYFDTDITGTTPNFNYKISTGALYREKNRDNFELRRNYDGYEGVYGMETTLNDQPVGDFLEGDYTLGYFPAERPVLEHFETHLDGYLYNASSSEQDSLSQNYDSYERVLGGYLNALFEFGEWSLSTGARYEDTKIETFGYEVIANVDDSIEVSPEYGSQTYQNGFPTLSIAYRKSESSLFQFSWQTTIARPDYYDLIPYQIIARSSEVVRSGNPNLRPTLLDTATLSWAKQLGDDSSLTLGISSVDIQDFIYSTEETIVDGTYEGFKFRSKFNGSSARIHGIDFSLSRVFEPSILKGKGITARVLHQYKESTADTDNVAFSETPLPMVARNKSRLSIEQTIGRLYWLLQMDYTDQALDQFGPSLSTFEYLDQRLTTNARIVYKIDQSWVARFDFLNIGNAPLDESIGRLNRMGKTTIDSWQCRVDIGRKW
ncbi:outer membrane beta-barrel protein [Pelagicoccus sp. SDUM812003]|uniref:outer membrane beta-barrel protein n=1 Tax=Pelagicoccus sp. SDUM812003 TaxID=3041267 RepID=UPI00280FC275|nr:outer membrane beta-barrel protein [Pelagicoccus sp. SDUM812003]MDQ8204692.1 outer membrane beta-barrel protein [Pelagicoccus sp. SDUM812003]